MGSLLRDGIPADDIFIQILTATQNSPACQSDPGRGKWTSSLADMMTRYMRDNREFVLNLSPHAQVNWERALSSRSAPRWCGHATAASQGLRGEDQEQEGSADGNGASAGSRSHRAAKIFRHRGAAICSL